jgi:hypothetical protein
MIHPIQGHLADCGAPFISHHFPPRSTKAARASGCGPLLPPLLGIAVETEGIDSFFDFQFGHGGFNIPLEVIPEPHLKVIRESHRSGVKIPGRGRPGSSLAPISTHAVRCRRRRLQKSMAAQDDNKAIPVKVQVVVKVID